MWARRDCQLQSGWSIIWTSLCGKTTAKWTSSTSSTVVTAPIGTVGLTEEQAIKKYSRQPNQVYKSALLLYSACTCNRRNTFQGSLASSRKLSDFMELATVLMKWLKLLFAIKMRDSKADLTTVAVTQLHLKICNYALIRIKKLIQMCLLLCDNFESTKQLPTLTSKQNQPVTVLLYFQTGWQWFSHEYNCYHQKRGAILKKLTYPCC